MSDQITHDDWDKIYAEIMGGDTMDVRGYGSCMTHEEAQRLTCIQLGITEEYAIERVFIQQEKKKKMWSLPEERKPCEENAGLKDENAQLQEIIKRLSCRITDLKYELSVVRREDLRPGRLLNIQSGVITELRDKIARLQEENTRLQEEYVILKEVFPCNREPHQETQTDPSSSCISVLTLIGQNDQGDRDAEMSPQDSTSQADGPPSEMDGSSPNIFGNWKKRLYPRPHFYKKKYKNIYYIMYIFNNEIISKNSESTIENHLTTIVWYIIFLAIIPHIIKKFYGFNTLRFYFPMIDLFANSFSASGGYNSIFKDLYSLSPNNIISFLSTNFINLIALMGVSWNGILYAFHHKNIWIGVSITLLMYIITYLAPTQMIPYVITKVQNKIDTYKPINIDIKLYNKTIHLEDYLAGIVLIFFLVLIEFIAISLYINFAKTL